MTEYIEMEMMGATIEELLAVAGVDVNELEEEQA